MRTRYGSMIGLLMLCSGCATAPQIVCPSLPVPPVRVQLGPSFQDEMQMLLQGSPPEPITSDPDSLSAKPGLTP